MVALLAQAHALEDPKMFVQDVFQQACCPFPAFTYREVNSGDDRRRELTPPIAAIMILQDVAECAVDLVDQREELLAGLPQELNQSSSFAQLRHLKCKVLQQTKSRLVNRHLVP